MRPPRAAARTAVRRALFLLLTAATAAAAVAQDIADDGRIAKLCASGHQEVIALMLRPDNLTRALECASGLDSADVDRGEVVARLLDDFGRGPRWVHEEVLAAALSGWRPSDTADSTRGARAVGRALGALTDGLPHLASPVLRAEALGVLQAAGMPTLAAIVGREAERLDAELRDGTRPDPALARLVIRIAQSAVAATQTPAGTVVPLLADVVARLVEVAPDRASVAAARTAAESLLVALRAPAAATAAD